MEDRRGRRLRRVGGAKADTERRGGRGGGRLRRRRVRRVRRQRVRQLRWRLRLLLRSPLAQAPNVRAGIQSENKKAQVRIV